MEPLYDQAGAPIAYIADDGEHIYLFSGEPVAFLHDGGIYAYSGRFLGWLEGGWVIDRMGNRALFTQRAQGGPVRPVMGVLPVRGVRGVRPVKGVREIRPVRPVKSLIWAEGPFFTE